MPTGSYVIPNSSFQAITLGPEELSQLVSAITAINAWNRLMISARVEPGHYEPAQAQPRNSQAA
jgi:hypothetical protein